MIKNEKTQKTLIYIILITLSLLLLVGSLQGSFATNITVDNNPSPITTPDHTDIGSAVNVSSSNDIIIINPGTYQGNANKNININKSLTFQGNGSKGQVEIDAQGSGRIFNITANNITVTFINLTFKNAYNTTSGGAIFNGYANSSMTFINCSFINNTVNANLNVSGGAIYNEGINLMVFDSDFSNNSVFVNGTGNSRPSGGAIFNNGTNLTVSGSNFTNNRLSYNGTGVTNGGGNF